LLTWIRSLAVVVAVVSLVSCGDNFEGPPDAPPKPACSDGRDNDGDGLYDFPDDPGCESPTSDREDAPIRPQCSDNRDNDGDGLIDYPNDPGCLLPESADEEDDCPDGPFCPQCANGIDDDASGARDFPGDAGCESAADNFEYAGSPQACGMGLTLKQLPASGVDMGMLDAMSASNLPTACGGGGGAPAIGYVMVLNRPTVVVISTAGSIIDTVLDLRRPPCQDSGSTLACHDDVATNDRTSRITRALAAGVYYIIVQGKTTAQVGPYTLTVQKFKGEGEMCTMQSDCGPGLICRVPAGGTQQICTKPVCSDGLDDDGDGLIDYPNDPGCDSPDDATEDDDCPSGPSCPECSNGLDDDGDGQIDYPADPSCHAASDVSESCVTSESITLITQAVTSGDTTSAVNDYDPICNSTTGLANDLLYRLDLPAMQTLILTVTGFDTVQTLFNSTCNDPPIACSDPQTMTRTDLPAGTYYVGVEGYFTTNSPFTLTTSGTIAPGGSCEGVLYQNGVISCPAGFLCNGPPGAMTCSTACTDGLDNDGDGKIDYPNDPGCSTPAANSEDDDCPSGPMCPACADGIDNDNDGQTDWPMDSSCPSAAGASETCTTSEPVGTITTAVTMGTTIGAVNDFDPTCNAATGLAPDVIYQIDIPDMATLVFNVSGFDTVTSLFNATCSSSIACSDPQVMTNTNLAAGTYYVSIEGYSTTSGAFTLTTSGEVAPGGSCEGVLFQNGVITCQPGFVCDGTPGARTCRTECTDGIDNNGDGNIDYPNDPGCTAPNDNSEDTVCPGPMCPVCYDGIDNDNDGHIDYPNDPQCLAASGSSEACYTSEPVGIITTQVTTGTTAGQVNDYKPSCGSTAHTAPDVLWQLDLPAMASLSLNLTGFDGAHALLDSQCGSPAVACSDPNLMTVTNLPASRYFVVVDGWSSGAGAYTLTTTGVIAAGGSCEHPLFTAGAFTCETGSTCQGPAGMQRCLSECSDGIDNNGDGRIDFPDDPACTNAADNSENTICPGPSCPVCGDGLDNDNDTAIDYPDDVGCASAAGTSEVFCGIEPDFAGVISQPTTAGTLAGAANNYSQTCQANTGNDVVYALVLPVRVQTLRVDTFGSMIPDTVISVKNSTCATQLGCNDDSAPSNHSLLNLSNVAPGNYAIQVDAYNTNGANHGPFLLNVRGTVIPGTACTSPLFASGVLVCGSGTSCTAGICQ
jgi:large repetitive protein